MKRRQVFWVVSGLLALLVAAAPVGYYIFVRAQGQHFYRGRPTSYWSREVKRYSQEELRFAGLPSKARLGHHAWSAPIPDKVLNLVGFQGGISRPAVLDGESSSVPVLVDLIQDADPEVRAVSLKFLRPRQQLRVFALRQVNRLGDSISPDVLEALVTSSGGEDLLQE